MVAPFSEKLVLELKSKKLIVYYTVNFHFKGHAFIIGDAGIRAKEDHFISKHIYIHRLFRETGCFSRYRFN